SGTAATAYRTLDSMVLVLPSGTVVDTAAPHADALLATREPELHAGLLRLRDHVRSRPDLRRRIEQQFAMKNTMGYGLNALLDHDAAVDILAHLVVRSEEHTSELQSRENLVCRLLLEKKKKPTTPTTISRPMK